MELDGVVRTLWPGTALGVVLACSGAWAGWLIGGHRSWLLVRFIFWWVVNVVRPLVLCESWALRGLLIFVNNIVILAALVAMGEGAGVAIVGAAALGVSLGIALRVIRDMSWDFAVPTAANGNGRRRLAFRLGIWLNALEPPAIAIAVGLSIARATAPLTAEQAWTLFLAWVAPAMLLAAAGEALWLGIGLKGARPRPPGVTG